MPPKRNNNPPPLDPIAVRANFGRDGPETLDIVSEEAAKLIDCRAVAMEAISAGKPVPPKVRLRMASTLGGVLLPFAEYDSAHVEILRSDPNFVKLVRKASAIVFAHKAWALEHQLGFSDESANKLLALAAELKVEASRVRRESTTSTTSRAGASAAPTSSSDVLVVDEDVTMSEPVPNRGRAKGKAANRASAPPTTQRMDYASVPGLDTGSPAFFRSMALASKRARADKEAPASSASSSAARTAHRLFPDGGLLDFIDDRAISNEFINLVLSKAHSAITNFTDRAENEESIRRALGTVRLEMISVVHKLHLFTGHWEMLNNEYASLKASLASFCTAPKPAEAPEVIPLEPGFEL
ncbi:hypothetical protein EST38_g12609 [Candolleomyces aberdarensis]|uniref:Uncharacterized protein n=1 Tax=Candolleomyces aberdarensis TaxID=2316362 RepID=A0A4Q2D1Z4_9AGAR|nr:hypothetical protein EST38_g12609 [Candolleomyces aberdarensis]